MQDSSTPLDDRPGAARERDDDPVASVGNPHDQDIFPNPLQRRDLPRRRRRWPKVLAAAGVMLVLGTVFLPQILSSRVGRKIVVGYIARKTGGAVTLESVKTSWFGGTSLSLLRIKDPVGRQIACHSLATRMSLLDFLRGRYDLGEATAEGVYFDYVIDDGRGSDTFDDIRRRTGAAKPAPGAPGTPGAPGAGGAAGARANALPALSGRIRVNSGTVVLHRGSVQPGLYNVTWQSARLANVKAAADIAALDRPWNFTFEADVVGDGDQPGGKLTVAARDVDLGSGGEFDASELGFSVTVDGSDLPTGPLGAVLIPTATPEDVQQALGAVFTKLQIAAKAADGKIVFDRCDASGPGSEIRLQPVIEMDSKPAALTVKGSANTLSGGVSKRLCARWGAYVNPFLREAAGGSGRMGLSIEQLRLPLSGAAAARTATAKGAVWGKGVMLARRDEMKVEEALPGNLASQLALLTGDTLELVPLDLDGRFSVAEGAVAVPPMTMRVGDLPLHLEGTTEVDGGAVRMTVAVTPGPSLRAAVPAVGDAGFALPLAGKVGQPQLGVLTPRGALPDAAVKGLAEQVNRQVARMRAKEVQRLQQRSQEKVQDLLRPLQKPEGN